MFGGKIRKNLTVGHPDATDEEVEEAARLAGANLFIDTQAICETWLQPFDRYSIWNMPIGSNAHYIPANIGKAGWVGVDKELFYQLNSNDPQRAVYAPYSWTERSRSGGQYQGLNLPISDNLIVEDCKPNETPNNASAFLMPDGHTIVQLNPLARPTVGGDMYGWRAPDQDITDMGIYGGHGGSGLSSIGGSIRKGELIDDAPIQHALKVNIWSNKYLQGQPRRRFLNSSGKVFSFAASCSGVNCIL